MYLGTKKLFFKNKFENKYLIFLPLIFESVSFLAFISFVIVFHIVFLDFSNITLCRVH